MKGTAATLAFCLSLCSNTVLAADAETPATEASTAAVSPSSKALGGIENRETVCKNGRIVRKVKLSFTDIKTDSGCKVSYLKETEEPGSEKVLWNAHNDAKFCQQNAEGFVAKLKGQGWSCE